MKTAIYFSVAILAVAFISSASADTSFCDTADDKVLCTQLVGAAKTWDEAMTNALKGAGSKAEGGKSVADVVAGKLPAEMKARTKELIVKTCHEAYDNIMENINDCMGFVKNDPNASLRVHLSALSYSDCTDGLAEFNQSVDEATQYDQEIHKLTNSLLSVSEKKP